MNAESKIEETLYLLVARSLDFFYHAMRVFAFEEIHIFGVFRYHLN